MDPNYTAAMVDLGTSLTTLAAKGTASAIASKIKAIRDEKNVEKVRQTYDEIMNELLDERQEAVRIAQVYRDELERIQISDDDIRYLNNTIGQILEVLKVVQPEAPTEALELFRQFVNADTLKAMQLLGFNYKAAFGEPLTDACAYWIRIKLAPQELTGIPKEKRAGRK